MCLKLPGDEPPWFQPEIWSGSAVPLALVAISVWLNLRPAKGGRPAIFYHLVALAVQLVLLRESSFYDWGAGPIALLILLGGLWRARPEPLATSSIPGLTRVPG